MTSGLFERAGQVMEAEAGHQLAQYAGEVGLEQAFEELFEMPNWAIHRVLRSKTMDQVLTGTLGSRALQWLARSGKIIELGDQAWAAAKAGPHGALLEVARRHRRLGAAPLAHLEALAASSAEAREYYWVLCADMVEEWSAEVGHTPEVWVPVWDEPWSTRPEDAAYSEVLERAGKLALE